MGPAVLWLAPGGSEDLAEQSAELLDCVLCDGHEIVGGLRPCECEHVCPRALHEHCDSVNVNEGDDGPGQDLGFGCVDADLGELGGEGVGDGRDLHDVSFRCFVFTLYIMMIDDTP